MILFFFHPKIILFFLSIFIVQVNAETKIIAKNGDTLFKLSKQYGVPLKELMHKNNLNNANSELKGKVILIPLTNNDKKNKFKPRTYKVSEGDTLYKIARDYNINVGDIISINNLNKASFLTPNQIILLPNRSIQKEVVNKEDIKIASKKVFYHQTSKVEKLDDIAKIHKVSKEKLIILNKLSDPIKVSPNTKLKIRENKTLNLVKYGSLIINWSEWRYLDGNYITRAKNSKNKSFYIALSCERRTLNNTLKKSYWNNWYFPKSDFEFRLINDFCDQELKI